MGLRLQGVEAGHRGGQQDLPEEFLFLVDGLV